MKIFGPHRPERVLLRRNTPVLLRRRSKRQATNATRPLTFGSQVRAFEINRQELGLWPENQTCRHEPQQIVWILSHVSTHFGRAFKCSPAG